MDIFTKRKIDEIYDFINDIKSRSCGQHRCILNIPPDRILDVNPWGVFDHHMGCCLDSDGKPYYSKPLKKTTFELFEDAFKSHPHFSKVTHNTYDNSYHVVINNTEDCMYMHNDSLDKIPELGYYLDEIHIINHKTHLTFQKHQPC